MFQESPIATITFTVPGSPRGKQRARVVRRGEFVRSYTPEKTVTWEQHVRDCFCRTDTEVPRGYNRVRITIVLYLPHPETWPKWRKEFAATELMEASKKPDWDNTSKLIGDALEALAYRNDCVIVRSHVYKFYSDRPRTVVKIEYFPEYTRQYAAELMAQLERSNEKAQ